MFFPASGRARDLRSRLARYANANAGGCLLKWLLSAGRPIAESDLQGNVLVERVYLGDIPVALSQ